VVGRVRSELIPGYAVASTPHEVVITQGEGDSFYVKGEVDGTTVFFAVDTGASDVTLTPADARRLGLDPDRLVYDRKYESANGAVFGAPYLIKSLTIGGITLNNVEASVNHADMSNSLLGLSFLRRLKSFEVRGRRLYLRS
jgi:aspartyl protease family protein